MLLLGSIMEAWRVAVLERLIKIGDLGDGRVEELLAFVDHCTLGQELSLALRHLNFKNNLCAERNQNLFGFSDCHIDLGKSMEISPAQKFKEKTFQNIFSKPRHIPTHQYHIVCPALIHIKEIKYHKNLKLMEQSKPEPQTQVEQQVKKQAVEEVKKEEEDFVVNPYTISSSTNKEIDYNKLIEKFGCYHITEEQIQRIEKYTKQPAHYFIRRGIFFSHRDLDAILTACETHKDPTIPPFYLYTGRGPSSEALHLGHMLPFIFCKYMQEAFRVPFIIQITDDEKYFHKEGGDLEEFTHLAFENIKDILAIGFDPENTFICLDSQYMGFLYPNVCRFQRHINLTTLKAIFGLEFSDCCGKAAYPAIQAAPCLSSSFPHFFGNKNIPCLIPCGIDQDPYFRMTRDVCSKLKAPKPAGLYNKFFPSLQGFNSKMSASVPQSGIFMTDTPKEIENKIKKHAFSGGRATKEEQEKFGADLSIDIPYQYLRFFLEDDKELQEIGDKYGSGKMLTGQIKKILIKVLQKFVLDQQERRKTITNQDVNKFLSTHKRTYVPRQE